MNKHIILASTSPRRKEILAEAGFVFDVVHSNYEEDMTLPMEPIELAKFLSKGKALSVAEKFPQSVVIAGDTFISFEDKVLGKPHTKERAKEMLQMLSGKSHIVISGFTIIDGENNKIFSDSVESKVYFRNLNEKEIDDYIATGEPLDKAAAYAIQGIARDFIEKTEGDYENILGLPIKNIIEALKDFGISSK